MGTVEGVKVRASEHCMGFFTILTSSNVSTFVSSLRNFTDLPLLPIHNCHFNIFPTLLHHNITARASSATRPSTASIISNKRLSLVKKTLFLKIRILSQHFIFTLRIKIHFKIHFM